MVTSKECLTHSRISDTEPSSPKLNICAAALPIAVASPGSGIHSTAGGLCRQPIQVCRITAAANDAQSIIRFSSAFAQLRNRLSITDCQAVVHHCRKLCRCLRNHLLTFRAGTLDFPNHTVRRQETVMIAGDNRRHYCIIWLGNPVGVLSLSKMQIAGTSTVFPTLHF